MTGKQILQPEDVTEYVRPVMWGPTGNYALSVEWNDGHSSLYPYQHIRALIEEEEKKRKGRKKQKGNNNIVDDNDIDDDIALFRALMEEEQETKNECR